MPRTKDALKTTGSKEVWLGTSVYIVKVVSILILVPIEASSKNLSLSLSHLPPLST